MNVKVCYVGCYNDRPTADLMKDFEWDLSLDIGVPFNFFDNLTIESCIKKCRELTYFKYAAVQNG